MAATRSFAEFLADVDGPEGAELAKDAAVYFERAGIGSERLLVGVAKSDLNLEGVALPLKGFVARALRAAQQRADAPTAGPAPSGVAAIAALLRAPDEPPSAHIAVGDRLSALALDDLPAQYWPRRALSPPPFRRCAVVSGAARSSELVDNAASELIRLKKRGIKAPFLYQDMRRWLPAYAAGVASPATEPDEGVDAARADSTRDLAAVRFILRFARAATARARRRSGDPR